MNHSMKTECGQKPIVSGDPLCATPRIKVGEIYRIEEKENYALICAHCLQEFEYYTEFILHVEKHLLENLENIIKSEIDEPFQYCEIIANQHENRNDFSEVVTEMNEIDEMVKIDEMDEIKCSNTNSITKSEQIFKICKVTQKYENPIEENKSIEDTKPKSIQIIARSAKRLISQNHIESDSDDEEVCYEKYLDKYKCLICSKIIVNLRDIKYHVDGHNNRRKHFLCPVCGKMFQSDNNVRLHLLSIHNQKYTCQMVRNAQKKCVQRPPSPESKLAPTLPEELKEKSIYEKVNGKYVCPICGEMRIEKRTYQMHLIMHKKPKKNISCPICDKKFVFVSYAQRHIVKWHNLKYSHEMIRKAQKYYVEPPLSVPTTTDAITVTAIETATPSVQTDLNKIDEIKSEPIDDNFVCPICGEIVIEKRHYEMHLISHNKDEKTFSCPICNEKFVTVKNTKTHIKREHKITYTTEMVRKAQRGYVEPATVSIQKNFIKEDKYEKVGGKYMCSICGELRVEKRSFEMHLIMHKKPKRNICCPLCDKKYVFVCYVQKHIASQHNQKYTLDQIRSAQKPTDPDQANCDADENTADSDADEYERNGRQYKCLLCGRTYKERRDIKVHIAVHKKKKKNISCPICNKKFLIDHYVQKHILKAHNQKYTCEMVRRAQPNYVDQEATITLTNLKSVIVTTTKIT